jgi:hypothetical protein
MKIQKFSHSPFLSFMIISQLKAITIYCSTVLLVLENLYKKVNTFSTVNIILTKSHRKEIYSVKKTI